MDRDRADSPVTAMATAGGRVLDIGTEADLLRRFDFEDHHDFGSAVVMPGFNDAHQHLIDVASAADQLDLSAPHLAASKDAIFRALSGSGKRESGWIRAFRYDDSAHAAKAITRHELDTAFGDRPVIVLHVSDHWAVLSSAALHRAGLPATTARVESSDLFRILWSDDAVVEKLRDQELAESMASVAQRYSAAGITSICDALVTRDQVSDYFEIAAEGALGLRVSMLVDSHYAAALLVDGAGSGTGDEWVRIAGFKGFVDGAVAACTCLTATPIPAGTSGKLIADLTELESIYRRVHRHGSVMAIHANGDRAIEMVLDLTERVQHDHPGEQRHRIEHCSIVSPALVERIAAAGMAVAPFGAYVATHGDKLTGWYGPAYADRMFAHRWFLDAGIPTGGSSDYSASPFEPLLAIESMVTRTTAAGRQFGASQAITPYEAMSVYTTGSAAVSGESGSKGTLTAGKVSDYVVLGGDPTVVDAHEISRIPVLQTTVGTLTAWKTAP